jgi:hypothetical protein
MKTTFKTFFLLLLISFSGSAFAQPCLEISKQINALKINIAKDRNVLAKLEATLRSNPRNLAKIQPQINKKINEIEFQKTKKKKLQDQYEDCLVKNKLANNKEDAKVIASTEKKMAKNAEIKKGNAFGKAINDDPILGKGNFVPKDKVQYTPAELAAKKKIKQDAKLQKIAAENKIRIDKIEKQEKSILKKETDLINREKAKRNKHSESVVIKEWDKEFSLTKKHTLQYALANSILHMELEKECNIRKSTDDIDFLDYTSKPPQFWNLKYMYLNFFTTGPNQVNIIAPLRKQVIDQFHACDFKLNKNLTQNDYLVIKIIGEVKTVCFEQLNQNIYMQFTTKMNNLSKSKK